MGARVRALVGTATFLVVTPGVVAGIMPWVVAGRQAPQWDALGFIGAVPVASGAGVLLEAFARFAIQGLGTPSPTEPTEHLVITGTYRWVRNPMYVAVLAIIIGQAAWYHSWIVVGYGAVVAVSVVAFVRLYEEPTLLRRYGAEYETYRGQVPGWWPRRPRPGGDGTTA